MSSCTTPATCPPSQGAMQTQRTRDDTTSACGPRLYCVSALRKGGSGINIQNSMQTSTVLRTRDGHWCSPLSPSQPPPFSPSFPFPSSRWAQICVCEQPRSHHETDTQTTSAWRPPDCMHDACMHTVSRADADLPSQTRHQHGSLNQCGHHLQHPPPPPLPRRPAVLAASGPRRTSWPPPPRRRFGAACTLLRSLSSYPVS